MARRLLVLCFVCSAAAPLWAARPAHVTLGPANREAGLSVPSGGDGENEPAFVDWRPCRRVAGERSQYLYVVVDPDRFAPGDQTIYVTCDLFDDAAQLIQVQYDSASPAPDLASKYRGGPSMVLLGSGRWVRRTVRLEHARLGKGQNFGADFRLCGKVTVARIRVSDEPPRDFDPDTALPADELAKLQVNAGPGQEITFGNDCDRVAGTLFRALGVTSVESYVTWQTVEVGWSGYVSPPEGALQFTQSDSALRMIRLLVSPFGAIMLSGTIILAWLFPLSREKHHRIQELLEKRRAKVSE